MSKSNNSTWKAEPNPDTYHVQHNWNDSEPLSTTVMTAVAEAMDADPTEIDPLYERFDPDSLDGLFRPRPSGVPRPGGHVAFTFHGHHVFIGSDGHVAIHPPDEGT